MKGCFVRCLFGDSCVDGYDGLVSHDLPLRAKDTISLEPCIWFTCGPENFSLVREVIGQSANVQSLWYHSVPDDRQDPDRSWNEKPDYLTQFGAARWGKNIYSIKFDAVYEAMMMGYDDCVFLDLDVAQTKPLPPDFWETLRDGQPVRAPLVQYHQRQCPWRKHHQRTSIYCATAYFRGLRVVERCLELARQHPLEYEQASMNRAIDELAGGDFPGHEQYKAMGFEFPFTRRKGGMIHQPIDPVFAIGSKGYSPWKRKGIAAWREHVEQILAERKSIISQEL